MVSMKQVSPVTVRGLAKKFSVVGDPVRLQILCHILSAQDICVSDVSQRLHKSVAITSHHLRCLAKEGFLKSTRNGKRICYHSVASPFMSDLKKIICKYKI